MRFSPFSKMLPAIMALFILGCIDQDETGVDAQDAQTQDIVADNQTSPIENQTAPKEELEPEFPETLEEDTSLHYAVSQGYRSICTEGEAIRPFDICHFTTPDDLGATTVIATVVDAARSVSDECSPGEVTLGNHDEAIIRIERILKGSSELEEIKLLYPRDITTPRLQEGDHILTTFFEDNGYHFNVATVYIEAADSDFANDDAWPSNNQDFLVDLPDSFGALKSLFTDGNSDACSWSPEYKDYLISRVIRPPDYPCNSASVSGGNHAPDEDNQPSNSASGG